MIHVKNSIEKDMNPLDTVLFKIKKKYGTGAIMKLGEKKSLNIDVIPSGSIGLDKALGVGGYPRGRIIEIYGPESSGKTTVALHAVAEAQKNNGQAAFIDAEHALDPVYAEKLGVKIDELLVSQPDSGEQALEITEKIISSGAVDLVVIDSVAALVPEAEIKGEMGDAHVGLQARLMSQAMRKLAATISNTNSVVIFINQIREKIGSIFANNETQPGGRALKFYATIRLDIRRAEAIKSEEGPIGHRTKVKVVKNKVAPPFKTTSFDLIFGAGIDHEGELIDLGVSEEIVEKIGAWYSFNELKLGQGRENAKAFLKQHREIYNQIAEGLNQQ